MSLLFAIFSTDSVIRLGLGMVAEMSIEYNFCSLSSSQNLLAESLAMRALVMFSPEISLILRLLSGLSMFRINQAVVASSLCQRKRA